MKVLLREHCEPLARAERDPLLNVLGKGLLWHQVATFEALAHCPLVVNTSATGTGKTRAAHTHLLRHPQLALFIAPTNALVAQHTEDVRQFVAQAGLPHLVIQADAASLRELRYKTPNLKGNGVLLYALLREPGTVQAEWAGRPLIIVTNPDIFVSASFFNYGWQANNLNLKLLGNVDYLVIDEVHYYSAIQLAGLFFSLALWAAGVGGLASRRILLLTATPEADLAAALDALARLGLAAFYIDPEKAAPDLAQVVTLAPIEVTFRPLGEEGLTAEDAEEALQAVHLGEDAAMLSDRLQNISLRYSQLEPRLGTQIRRITGPTPAHQRLEASQVPLILATPTVDLGFNFEGRLGKDRQPLDRVWFEAPTLDRFWQRLGRAGRVLKAQRRDIASHAVARIPKEVLDHLDLTGVNTRADLRQALNKVGAAMQRPAMSQMLRGGAGDALAFAWAGFASVLSDYKTSLKPIYDIIAEATGWMPNFEIALRRGQALRELDAIRNGQPIDNGYHHYNWLPWSPQMSSKIQNLKNALKTKHPKALEIAAGIAIEEGACLSAALAFRGEDGGGDVIAWDGIGRYADRPAWVILDLWRLLCKETFVLLEGAEISRFLEKHPDEERYGKPLRVILTGKRDVALKLALCIPNDAIKDRRTSVIGTIHAKIELEDRSGQVPLEAKLKEKLDHLLSTQGLALYVPPRPGRTRERTRPYNIFPKVVRILHPYSEDTTDGWIGTSAILAHALDKE